MAKVLASSNVTLIVGAGVTGLSVARYLTARGERFLFADEHLTEQKLQYINEHFAEATVLAGAMDADRWQGVSRIVLSPGVPRKHPQIERAIESGIDIVGDIELFAEQARAPIVAITGSNGKSTVTKLVGEMAENCNLKVAVGGNYGTPALDLLDSQVELYVLELSSFQLESTRSLAAQVASVLNISQDHMDRYDSLANYFLTKQKIYFKAKNIVLNKDDPLTQPPLAEGVKVYRFTTAVPDLAEFGLRRENNTCYLCKGQQRLLDTQELRVRGIHNFANALAAMAIGAALELDLQVMVQTLKEFEGLPHRCVLVKRHRGVDYVNDSKATNVGAAIAAIEGLHNDKNIILIAGGDGKGADFAELVGSVASAVKKLLLIGKDARHIADACAEVAQIDLLPDLGSAVRCAYNEAVAGDLVLLSPACASLDMFANYQDRGEQFVREVNTLCQ